MSETTNIYGEIRSLDELRTLFAQLRDEALKAETRRDLLEIKEGSEYLCNLADNPIWRDEQQRGGLQALDLCKEKDAELSKLLNDRSRDLVASGDAFRPWREGDDSNAVRNV
ncbi:MAG: hypothetical protein AB7P33_15310 [Dehalococcoidia bacterium]